MQKYIINGGKRLSGSIVAQTSKNAVLPILAGSILTDEQVVIKSCPKMGDVLSMIKILSELGVKCTFYNDDLLVEPKYIDKYKISSDSAKELRSSIFLLGALISRFKKADVPLPGGCEIGLRPIDIHISALRQLGVIINESQNGVVCRAEKLNSGVICLSSPSVGATENVILASIFIDGTVVVKNCAREPEIVDLANFLNQMGAKIRGAGNKTIVIEGVKRLYGTEYRPISDRIEIGTFLLGSLITGGEIEIKQIDYKNIRALINKICDNTCAIRVKNDIIYIKSGIVKKPFNITTGPFPKFPTDLQSQMLALSTICCGHSVITERIFENRFRQVDEFKKMGAIIRVNQNRADVFGVKSLHGASVTALDLRGGASLVLAGLNAEGQTTVVDVSHIERGYYQFTEKLSMLGADITKKD